MKKEYFTDNKRLVTDFFFKNKNRHYTIDGVFDELRTERGEIPKSSLYRIIGNLCKAGTLKRFETKEVDSFVYQYANFGTSCESHFHLKCTECGKLIHLECEKLSDLRSHILKDHGFIIGGDGIINGICIECKEKNDEKNNN